MRALLAIVVAASGACSFRADFDGTHYACGAGDACPVGTSCVAGECRADDAPDAPIAPTPDAAPAATCGTLSLLRDDFEAPALARRWMTFAIGSQTIESTGGALHVAAPAGGNWGGLDSRSFYDFTEGQLGVTVDAVGTGGWTGIEAIRANDQRLQFFVQDGVLTAEVWVGGAQTVRATTAYDPVAHRRWRLRVHAGQVAWETSPDGAAWTALWTEVAPFPLTDVRARISAGSDASAIDARFADVNGDAVAPAGMCAASSIHEPLTSLTSTFATFTATGCAVAFGAGGVAITSQPTSVNSCGLLTRHLYDLTAGPIYVDAGGAASGPSHVAFLRAASEEAPDARLAIERAADKLRFVQSAADGTETTRVEVPYDPALRYWRLRIDGDVVRLGVSVDGSSFVDYTNSTLAIDATAVRLTIGAGHTAAQGAAVTSTFGAVD